jgi:Plavaka transposase
MVWYARYLIPTCGKQDFHPEASDVANDPESPNVVHVQKRRLPRTIPDHLPLPPLGVFTRAEERERALLLLPAAPLETGMSRNISLNGASGGIWTLPNKFGISRRYFDHPTSIPDQDVTLTDLTDPIELYDLEAELARLTLNNPDGSPAPQAQYSKLERALDIIYPHPNLSSFLMNNWFYRRGSVQKSKLDRSILVNDVILNPSFDPLEIAPPFNFNALDDLIVSNAGGIATPEQKLGTGWFKSDATIDVPATGQHPRTRWSVPGAYHRDVTQVIRRLLQSPTSANFNYDGFEEWWQPPSTTTPPIPKQRVYHNVYTADAFLQAEAALRASEPRDYTGPPRRVIGLMFWSDSTHLTDFGQASLHPIYMAFANQSKADRCQPNKRGLHHVAYMPEVSF